MRLIPEEMQTRLAGGTTRICRCWKVTRRDGVSLGFTDHDCNLTFDETLFVASSGMDASTLESSTGLSVDNGQAVGALSALGLRDADILAGRYDGAEVVQWLVDWQQPELRVMLFRGSLGEVRQAAGAFEAELRGLTEPLNQPVGRAYVTTCDRALGDAKCRFDLDQPGYTADVEIGAVSNSRRFLVPNPDGIADGWFKRGVLRWTGGANAGAIGLIKADRPDLGQRSIELWEEPAYPVQPGDNARVEAGCDKTPEACLKKFNNFNNFRGFPHMPGEDWVLAYPKGGEIHDGSSQHPGTGPWAFKAGDNDE